VLGCEKFIDYVDLFCVDYVGFGVVGCEVVWWWDFDDFVWMYEEFVDVYVFVLWCWL